MKTREIKGIATVIDRGQSCVGCMAWETPYIKLAINGERFKYQSERIETLYDHIEKGAMIQCVLRVKDNGNVFRFSLICVLDY